MPRQIDKIVNAASGRNVLLFLVPSLAIYFLMLFSTIPTVQSHAPGMKIFDLSPAGYSYDYAIKLLTALGSEGRDAYLTIQLPLDFIYPGLFAISSALLLAWLFLKRDNKDSKILTLSLVPLFGGLFDYLENIQVLLMLLQYPDISKIQVALASAATVTKSGLVTLFFLLLIFAVARLWIGKKSV